MYTSAYRHTFLHSHNLRSITNSSSIRITREDEISRNICLSSLPRYLMRRVHHCSSEGHKHSVRYSHYEAINHRHNHLTHTSRRELQIVINWFIDIIWFDLNQLHEEARALFDWIGERDRVMIPMNMCLLSCKNVFDLSQPTRASNAFTAELSTPQPVTDIPPFGGSLNIRSIPVIMPFLLLSQEMYVEI